MTIEEKYPVDTTEMRFVYAKKMEQLFTENPKIMLLDADLMTPIGVSGLWKKYPAQVINCGIQEANMIGVAAGLSREGFIPFAHSFGAFASRRTTDQVFMSCAYAKGNVKIVGSDPGAACAYNGGTHAANEDISIMRAIPEVKILVPTDRIMLEKILPLVAADYATYYLRLFRRCTRQIYSEADVFEIGKAKQLKDGGDLTIIAEGLEVFEALAAAEQLESQGIHARVLDMFTIRPLDTDSILKAAKETGAILTAENHSVTGGLGSAVAEAVCKNSPVPMAFVGINGFGEVGPIDYLMDKFGLTAKHIVKKAQELLAKK